MQTVAVTWLFGLGFTCHHGHNVAQDHHVTMEKYCMCRNTVILAAMYTMYFVDSSHQPKITVFSPFFL